MTKTLLFAGTSVLFLACAAPSFAQQAKPPVPAKAGEVKELGTVTLAVTGLTQKNVSAVEDGLRDLKHPMFECKTCKTMQAKAGACTGCKKELTKTDLGLFKTATASVADETIRFELAAGQSVLLSQLSGVLSKHNARIPPATLMLPLQTELLLSGITSEEIVNTLTSGLQDSKRFTSVTVEQDSMMDRYYAIVTRAAKEASLEEVTKLVTELVSTVKVTDARWLGLQLETDVIG